MADSGAAAHRPDGYLLTGQTPSGANSPYMTKVAALHEHARIAKRRELGRALRDDLGGGQVVTPLDAVKTRKQNRR
jgi:hypothetical protein